MIKHIVKYVACDGKEFTEYESCVRHEQYCSVQDFLLHKYSSLDWLYNSANESSLQRKDFYFNVARLLVNNAENVKKCCIDVVLNEGAFEKYNKNDSMFNIY